MRILALLLALAVLFAPAAGAQEPGTWPANNRYLNALDNEAQYQWMLRGVSPGPAQIWFVHQQQCGYCWAVTPPPFVFTYVNYERFALIQNRPGNWQDNADLCYVMVHESGHRAGFGHWSAGWMSVFGPEYMPMRCRQIASARAAGGYYNQ